MKVSGYITDSYGNTEGATIQLYRDGEGTTLGVASNQDGYFEIDNDDIKPNDEFKISFIGLKPQIKKENTKKIEEKWYLNPLFLISTLTLESTRLSP